MNRWTLIAAVVAVAVSGLSACATGGGVTGREATGGETATASATAAPTAQVLLDASQLPGGPWTAERTGDVRWADLDEALVPCGKRLIAPETARVRFRVFASADGVSISEIVVSGTDTTQTFKRFYAECSSAGKVEGRPGPANVVLRGDTTEVAVFTDDHLVVVNGPTAGDDLGAIAATARDQAAKAG
ncbi:hypothetical protein [Streptosporangium sp. NPDC002721]|uniref:hypothetical protein n=1 Tax=Streptosporangium sp. NPDC002721 TaxID=3366188 RepID=UPI00368F5877